MKVMIVDDHSLFRGGLIAVFNSQPDFEVVGEAGTIKEALSQFETKMPDLLIMDVGLPDGSGIEAIHRFLRIKEDVAIVILTIHASDELAFSAIRLGAKGFLLKDISAPAMLNALRRLRHGELAVSRAILGHFIDEALPLMVSRTEKSASEVTLTMREIEVLGQLATGDSNLEIARRLCISENTLKVHVHNVLHKLKLRNRQEAAEFTRRHGFNNIALDQLKDETATNINSEV
jgi:two-component system nitrate/nitrite response regulator NarL